MAIVLKQASATCPVCGAKKHQIDTTSERAVQVVTEAMERHMAEEHPEWRT